MKQYNKKNGFSLIEIIVVTGVVSLAFMAILSLVKRTIMIYYSSQNYLMASIIAQDGLELTRYVRDQNWLVAQPSFSTNLSQYRQADAKTIIAIDHQLTADDPLTDGLEGRTKIKQLYNSQEKDKVSDCGSWFDNSGNMSQYIKSPCAVIYTDTDANTNGYYVSQTVNGILDTDSRYKKTIYSRLLEITYYDNGTAGNADDDYIYVSSMVYWRDRGSEKYFTLGAYLYDYSWKY